MYNYFAHLKLKNSNNVSLGFYQQSHVQVDLTCPPKVVPVFKLVLGTNKKEQSQKLSQYT